VIFKLFASLQDYLPVEARMTNTLALELDEGVTVEDVIARFALPRKSCKLVLVDGNFVPPEACASRTLKDGETLAIWPPVAGG
jgi:sulfur carrier protein ThiS